MAYETAAAGGGEKCNIRQNMRQGKGKTLNKKNKGKVFDKR